ncbi:MAG: hypothetical protein J6U20_06685 [Fibrobacter sp.]|nr:hypothetical protein [Fibrobacter sp.]
MKYRNHTLPAILLAAATVIAAPTILPEMPQLVDGCYQIGTAAELYGFAIIANAYSDNTTPFCAKLTGDIELNKDVQAKLYGDLEWTPINKFNGEFDGQGHTISGLYFNDSTATNAGLFASISNRDTLNPTTIKNLNIADAYIRGGINTAALVGEIDSTSKSVTIENCQVKATINNGFISGVTRYLAGFVGHQRGGELTIKESASTPTLAGLGDHSAFVGYISGKALNIINSYSVILNNSLVNYGGFLGSATPSYNLGGTPITVNINIENSFAFGIITGSKEFYYLAPSLYNTTPVTLKNVFYVEPESGPVSTGQAYFRATEELFKNGTVAHVLQRYKSETADGSVWGQIIGTDSYPKHTGTISGASSVKISPLSLTSYYSDTVTFQNTYVEGIDNLLPIPEREGYIFKGWHNFMENGNSLIAVPPNATGSMAYYAEWWHIPLIVNNCYEIGSIDELYQFAEIYNSSGHDNECVKLTADIKDNRNVLFYGDINTADSSEFSKWVPIQGFRGTFDGQGHSISGLFYNSMQGNAGLFSSFGGDFDTSTIIIKDLTIKDSYFSSNYYAGSIVGVINGSARSLFINVTSESQIESKGFAGGIIGRNSAADGAPSLYLVNVHHDGSVTAHEFAGGIAGSISHVDSVTLLNVSSTGTILADLSAAGLISQLGSNEKTTMEYSFHEGRVRADAYAAGLFTEISGPIKIQNSYHVGNVIDETTLAGGLLGITHSSDTLINTYNKGHVTSLQTFSPLVASFKKNSSLTSDNLFYLEDSTFTEINGTAQTETDFTDLSLANKLHDYNKNGIDGLCWGQEAGDAYPTFKKTELDNYTKAFLKNLPLIEWTEESSSSVYMSSSSFYFPPDSIDSSTDSVTTSSSSKVKSSSSSGPSASSGTSSSSSKAKSSSSSSKVKSSSSSSLSTSSGTSSSSSKAKSSSSSSKVKSSSSKIKSSSSSSKVKSSSSKKGKTSIAHARMPAAFKVTIMQSHILISGAPIGANCTLLDLQGRIISQSQVTSPDFQVAKPIAGTYVIRVMDEMRPVAIH